MGRGLGEGALAAVAGVGGAEGVEDFKKSLEFEDVPGAQGAVGKEAGHGDLRGAVGLGGGDVGEAGGRVDACGDEPGGGDIDKDVGDAAVPEQGDAGGGGRGAERGVAVEERVAEAGEALGEGGGVGVVEFAEEVGDAVGEEGEGGDAALGMIGGAGLAEVPEVARHGGFGARMRGPPGAPEAGSVGTVGFAPGGDFDGGQESGFAEEAGFAVDAEEWAHRGDGTAPGEDAKGDFIFLEAEGFCEPFPEGLFASVAAPLGGDAAGAAAEAEEPGLGEEAAEVGLVESGEGGRAGARFCGGLGCGVGRQADGEFVEGDLEEGGEDGGGGGGAGGERDGAGLAFEGGVEDKVIVFGVAGMAVGIPIGGAEMKFDVAGADFAVGQAEGGVAEIGAGFAVPPAGLDDFDGVAAGERKAGGKEMLEPEALENGLGVARALLAQGAGEDGFEGGRGEHRGERSEEWGMEGGKRNMRGWPGGRGGSLVWLDRTGGRFKVPGCERWSERGNADWRSGGGVACAGMALGAGGGRSGVGAGGAGGGEGVAGGGEHQHGEGVDPDHAGPDGRGV